MPDRAPLSVEEALGTCSNILSLYAERVAALTDPRSRVGFDSLVSPPLSLPLVALEVGSALPARGPERASPVPSQYFLREHELPQRATMNLSVFLLALVFHAGRRPQCTRLRWASARVCVHVAHAGRRLFAAMCGLCVYRLAPERAGQFSYMPYNHDLILFAHGVRNTRARCCLRWR